MLASSGEATDPCPVPLSLTVTIPSSRMPALSHLWIRRMMRLSPIRSSRKLTSHSRVPAPPPLGDMIMRNLAVVEGMDLDALRTGINWQFQSFAEYMTMLRGRGAYMNVGVLVGHSAVRTAVMGEDASMRKEPTAAELAEMSRLVAEAMDEGAIGTGASYSLNHSGWGGVPTAGLAGCREPAEPVRDHAAPALRQPNRFR